MARRREDLTYIALAVALTVATAFANTAFAGTRITDGVVSVQQLQDGAVTGDKLAPDAV